MKRLLIISLFVCAAGIVALGALFASPYYFYNKIVNHNYQSKWYRLENYRPQLLAPTKGFFVEEEGTGNEDLWKVFHFGDTLVPLPVKNPFYSVGPLLSYDKKRKITRTGLALYGMGGRDISKLYFVSNVIMDPETRSQELFKLPFAMDIIKSAGAEKVWKDLFTKDLSIWNIPFSEMVYNLYLLQLRSKIFPSNLIEFSGLDSDTGVARLESQNKDYFTELVMTRSRGVIYSYIIVTEKDNRESAILRFKFLNEVGFRPGSEALAGILYKEFKALDYDQQIADEGMLYLLSAWSHDMDKKEYLKELIFYMERGEGNEKQLETLYAYASDRYGEVFTRRLVEGVKLEAKMRLKRNIELENQREMEALKDKEIQGDVKPISREDRLKARIEDAKKNKTRKSSRMILD